MTRRRSAYTTVGRARRHLYRAGSILGDTQAILRPRRIPRRVANKFLGRTVVRAIFGGR